MSSQGSKKAVNPLFGGTGTTVWLETRKDFVMFRHWEIRYRFSIIMHSRHTLWTPALTET